MDLLRVATSFGNDRCQGNTKSWNVFTGGSSFFKGIFLTNAMKSITMASVCGETAGPFSYKNGHNLSSWIPS